MRLLLSIAAAGAAFIGAASAGTVTSNTFVDPKVHDFSGGASGPENVFLPASATRMFTVDGINVTFSHTSFLSVYEYIGGTSLVSNGGWDAGRNGYVSTLDAGAQMAFEFDQAVSAVGGLFNYARGAASGTGGATGLASMAIYDTSGNLLETFDIANDAPYAAASPSERNVGVFRGFQRATADIGMLVLSGDFLVFDDLTFSLHEANAPVPLPGALPFMAAGLGAMGWMRKKKAS